MISAGGVIIIQAGTALELQTNLRKDFMITEKAPARAFFLLESAISTFTFQTLLRHYAKRTLTPQFLNVKVSYSQQHY